jgi:hypothetical protein
LPRNSNTTIENNFIGGLVSQATALNFPPNAAIDQDNCLFTEFGLVSRRLGFEFENNFTTNTQDRTEKAQSTYYWKNASADGLTNLVVQQNGDTLSFYNTNSTLSLSAGLSANTVSLTSFQASGSTSDNLNQNECQYSTGLGYLFVVHPYCDPFYIQYNPSGGTFTASIITFTVRDIYGITEAVLVDNRPTSLTANHNYNLLNQGWTSTNITTFHTGASAYPSNADVWWIFKDSTNAFVVNATTLASNNRGSSPAPQGFIRLNPWNTARAATCLTQTGVSLSLTGTVDQTSGTLRPSVTEFHAGRVWYAGVTAQGYNGLIYFTRVVQDTNDFGWCAATNDPTSETLFDFVASDGGVISIPQAGPIYRLISLGPNLIVFGANGVWAITGSRGIGFSADDYNVANLSYVRSLAGTSYVVAEGSVYWWNTSDINVLAQSNTGYDVKSLTYDKIKDFYVEDIPSANKKTVRGAYNPRTHTIQWLYRTAVSGTITQTYSYDSVMSLNLLSGAFYTWSVDTSVVSLNSIVVIEGASSVTGTSNVIDSLADQVIDGSGNIVTTYGFSGTTVQTATKFLASYSNAGSYKFTFAESFNPAFLDWQQKTGGIDYDSFFVSGYSVKTQGIRKFQSNYIYLFNDLKDVATLGQPSYVFQSQWNFSNNRNSGKWTQTQLITHDETFADAARRRLKVRGTGVALQFRITSVTGKSFSVVGWSTFDTATQAP